MDDREYRGLEAMRTEMGGGFQRWKPYIHDDKQIGFDLVLDPWTPSEYTEWVRAEDAIRREAQLIEQIRALEERVAQSTDLIAKAVGMLGGRAASAG
ncbi:hypothetical protein P0D71_00710 [Paraburkholderia sp. RL17-383-BIF-A]|uniref:hypothetical protein n=1 Tax=Paraburkholderia sp. RL17-383-BIF-A TaxID=3031631 RepID=UPI0038BC34FA